MMAIIKKRMRNSPSLATSQLCPLLPIAAFPSQMKRDTRSQKPHVRNQSTTAVTDKGSILGTAAAALLSGSPHAARAAMLGIHSRPDAPPNDDAAAEISTSFHPIGFHT